MLNIKFWIINFLLKKIKNILILRIVKDLYEKMLF